jgi:hypothetical protein
MRKFQPNTSINPLAMTYQSHLSIGIVGILYSGSATASITVSSHQICSEGARHNGYQGEPPDR